MASWLTGSNPWEDKECEKNDCVMCSSAGEKDKRRMCRKRNIVYKIFCIECGLWGGKLDNDSGEIEGEKDVGHDKVEEKKEYRFKYIGETNRLGYERGKEHSDIKRNYNEKSHMLRYCLLYNRGRYPEEIRFGMKWRKQYRTAIERQIGDDVAILEEKEKGFSKWIKKVHSIGVPSQGLQLGIQRNG